MPTTCFSSREILTANRTYYVATTGSDSNNGLSSGSPFLTIQKAIDVACTEIDLNVYNVTIQVADGTYAPSSGVRAANLKPYLGVGRITLQGNTTTPSNVILSTTNTSAISGASAGPWNVKGFKLTTTTSGDCLSCGNDASISFESINFGTCAGYHIISTISGFITASGNYSVSGNATQAHICANRGTVTIPSRTITFSNSPIFTHTALSIYTGWIYIGGCTFTNGGTVTAYKYYAGTNSVIETNTGDVNYLPGNSAGSTGSGGEYT